MVRHLVMAALASVSLLGAASAQCDEAKGFSKTSDPASALKDYGKQKKLFPTRTAVGQCGAVNGYPSSIARPELWASYLFTNADGTEARNNAANDLLVEKTYGEKGRYADVYEQITVKHIVADLFPGGRLSADRPSAQDQCRPAGYNGTPIMSYTKNGVERSPGPTVKQCTGRQSVIRFCNQATRKISVHLHGSGSVAPYDGWAEDVTLPYECKEYWYPDNRATTLWYHDHAVGITADNAYAGLAGQYIVRDCDSRTELMYMPHDKYSIPFMLKDVVISKTLNAKGEASLVYEGGHLYSGTSSAHKDYIMGDINLVNGRAWATTKVEQRTYRMHWLDMSISRDWSVKFIAETEDGTQQAWVDFYLVGTDGGALQTARKLNHLYIAVSERYETLINFSAKGLPPLINNKPWKYVYAVNDFGLGAATNAPYFCKSHLLARFDILPAAELDLSKEFERECDSQWPPPVDVSEGCLHETRALRNLISNKELQAYKERAMRGESDRQYEFGHGAVGDPRWTINGLHWGDEAARTIANPARDGIELWKIKSGGGWHHPVHIHLVDFLVLRGEGRDKDQWVDWDTLQQSRGVFSSLDPFRCTSDKECPTGRKCDLKSNVCASTGACSSDQQCNHGSYCMSGACVANGLRDWEQDAPKDVVHLGNSQTMYVLARFGPHDGDYMFHCHSLVHEDSDMMLGFGVGRVADGVANPWTAGASAEPADDKWAVPKTAQNAQLAIEDSTVDDSANTAADSTAPPSDLVAVAVDAAGAQAPTVWTGLPYVSQTTPSFKASGALSPYSEQLRNGTTHAAMRDAMSDRGRVELAPVTDSVHHCSRMREGFYDVFYPDHSVLGKHFTKRKPAEYGSDDAPVCTYMYNPLQQNLWAINYEDSDIQTIPEPFVGLVTDGKPKFVKRKANWSTSECIAKVSLQSCTSDQECSDKYKYIGAACNTKTGYCAVLQPSQCFSDAHCKFSPHGNTCAGGFCTGAMGRRRA